MMMLLISDSLSLKTIRKNLLRGRQRHSQPSKEEIGSESSKDACSNGYCDNTNMDGKVQEGKCELCRLYELGRKDKKGRFMIA